MSIPRNPDGTLVRMHPFAPTYAVVLRNGRTVYHEQEAFIRSFMAANLANVISFYVVKCGRTIVLPLR